MDNVGMSMDQQPDKQQNSIDMRNYKFSPEEMRIFGECAKESFYKRSLPMGSALGMFAYFAVKAGYTKPSPRFGAWPKVFGMTFLGYIIGKASYQTECMKKIMTLPNSPLAQVLRTRLQKKSPEDGRDAGYFEKGDVYTQEFDGRTEFADMSSTLDIDTDRPSFSTGDDSLYRSTLDSFSPSNDSAFKPTITYDDLRKQNRQSEFTPRANPYSRSGDNI